MSGTPPQGPRGILTHTSDLPHTLPASTYPQVCSSDYISSFLLSNKMDIGQGCYHQVSGYASVLIACPAVQVNAFCVHLAGRGSVMTLCSAFHSVSISKSEISMLCSHVCCVLVSAVGLQKHNIKESIHPNHRNSELVVSTFFVENFCQQIVGKLPHSFQQI